MFHNLSPVALGITGRQSELIELALTYGFGGLNLDLPAIVKRARKDGAEQACRFIASAGIKVGIFDLPIDLLAPEMTFRSSLSLISEYAAVGQQLNAACCRATLSPVSNGMPYQECFELHRARLREVAELLAPHQVRLAIAFRGAAALRVDCETPFIYDGASAMTLVRTIGHSSVGLALDTWNWFVAGGTLDELRQLPLETIAAVNLADAPADADLSTIGEDERDLPGRGGLIDCRAVMQYLRDGGYKGPVSLVPAPGRFVGMTRDAIVQLAQATYKDLLNPTPPLDAAVPDQVDETDDADSPPASAAGESGAANDTAEVTR